jgi:hypothetical protein
LTKLPLNDANQVLIEEGSVRLMRCIFDASPYIPSCMISKEDLWEALVKYHNTPSVPYPDFMEGINAKAKGTRQGEIALFVSGTSLGKSTIMREIMLSMKKRLPMDGDTPDKIGIVSLEEAPAETARKLAGMVLHRNPAIEPLTLEELKPGFDEVFADDRYILMNHQGNMKDESIIDRLEYMALSGCTAIIIDHITILVSEGAETLTGNEAIDKVMNDLLRFVKRYPVWIGLVSHLRKTGSGSGKSFEEGKMPTLDDIKGCLAYGTVVMMCDGTHKFVQDIEIGDKLMGASGDARVVQELRRGRQQMYKIAMKTSGDSFICNEDHILTLSFNDRMFDISVKDFLKQGDSFKYRCKQHYSQGYELPKQDLIIPPYALGAWLGDGSKSAFRIIDASELGIAERVAEELGASVSYPKNKNKEYCNFITAEKGELLNKLKRLNVYENKHIPESYRYSSIRDRLELLAGLLDTDGTYSIRDKSFCFYQKDFVLANTVKEIARSVGLYSSIRSQVISSEYSSNGSIIFQVAITGEIDKIPTQKPNKSRRLTNSSKRGIVVEKLDVQDYYGFVLDGDGRFLLGNHIITHNSGSIKQICFDIFGFARNLMEEDLVKRNTIEMAVLKCRFTGLTGPAGTAYYNNQTGRFQKECEDQFKLL